MFCSLISMVCSFVVMLVMFCSLISSNVSLISNVCSLIWIMRVMRVAVMFSYPDEFKHNSFCSDVLACPGNLILNTSHAPSISQQPLGQSSPNFKVSPYHSTNILN